MTIKILPEAAISPQLVNDDIFSNIHFHSLLAQEFRLQNIGVKIEIPQQINSTLPAFLHTSWLGKQTLILGAGFDRTTLLPTNNTISAELLIEHLCQELAHTPIHQLQIRTAEHIPCLHDHSDKVELQVHISDSAEAIWQQLSTNTRKNIRRPLKRGFSSKTGNDAELLETFYQLYRMSLHDIGSLPHSKQFFTNLLEQCPQQIEIFVGYMDGIPTVTSLNFVSADEIYGAWSGIHSDYKRHNVFLAMLWQMIEHCEQTGRKTYNLGRSSTGSNPHQFKCKLATHSHKIYYYEIPIQAAQTARSVAHDAASWLIRNTPEIVMDTLSRGLLHRFY